MPIVHVNGFGTIPVSGDAITLGNASGGTSTFSRVAGRNGGFALRHVNSTIQSSTSYAGRIRLPASYQDFSVAFALNHVGNMTTQYDAAGIVWAIDNSYEYRIGIGTGSSNTYSNPSGTSAWTILDGSVTGVGWHWYNLIYKYHATAGLCQFWRDGILLAQTGTDTIPTVGFSGSWYVFNLYMGNAAVPHGFEVGDLIFRNDNVAIPDSVVTSLYPDATSAGAWVGSDGNSADNHLLVNENPTYSAAAYVGSGTLNAQDTYTLGNLPGTASSVHAVQVAARSFKSDGGARQLQTLINAQAGTATDPGGGATVYQLATTSDGSTAWNTASVNAATVGLKVAN